MKCTFFGHRDAENSIAPVLEEAIEDLIINKNTDVFYVGNQGGFDSMVKRILIRMKNKYPHIRFYVVYAYYPTEKTKEDDSVETFFPEGLEKVPPRFAIDKRNRWMIKNADFVITYVQYTVGGAAKYKAVAEKANKTVVHLDAKSRLSEQTE